MTRAIHSDKDLIVNILVDSFEDNKSVNYIIRQDNKKLQRIRKLIEYSYDVCNLFGDVFISEDKKGCALVIMPDRKKVTRKSIFLDAKLAISCMGLSNTKKAMDREAKIKSIHPKGLLYYLWFIGVSPDAQNTGIGSKLLNSIIEESRRQNRVIILETSTEKNLPWYEKHGFTIYNELDFGYRLYCLKME